MKKILTAMMSVVLAAGLMGTTGCSNKEVGLVGGGAIGGVAGSALTGGSAVGTAVGAVGGAYVGHQLAR